MNCIGQRVEIKRIREFLEKYGTCYVWKGRKLQISGTILVHYTNFFNDRIYLGVGKYNATLIPKTVMISEGLTANSNVYLYDMDALNFQESRRKEIHMRQKANRELRSWQFSTQERLDKTKTKYEDILYNKLRHVNGINKIKRQYIFKYGPNKTKAYFFDIYIPSLKVVVEVDGGYHNNPEQIQKDIKRDTIVRKLRGIRTIRIKNEDVLNDDVVNNLINDILHKT